jgi:hypothetical protein
MQSNMKWLMTIGKKGAGSILEAAPRIATLMYALFFLFLFLVAGTILYAEQRDNQEPRTPRTVLNAPVAFTIDASDTSFTLTNEGFGGYEDTLELTSTPDDDTPPLFYRVSAEYGGGDANLCGAIHATSTSLQYDGLLQSLEAFPVDSTDSSWEMNFYLGDGAVLEEGAECTILMHALGWDQKRTMHLDKYRDEQVRELTFRVDNTVTGAEVLQSLIEIVSAPFTGTESDSTKDEEMPDDEITENGGEQEVSEPAISSEATTFTEEETSNPAATSTESVLEPEEIVEAESSTETTKTVSETEGGEESTTETPSTPEEEVETGE